MVPTCFPYAFRCASSLFLWVLMNHGETAEGRDLPPAQEQRENSPLNECGGGGSLFRKKEGEDEGQKHLSAPGRVKLFTGGGEWHKDTAGNQAFPLERASQPTHACILCTPFPTHKCSWVYQAQCSQQGSTLYSKRTHSATKMTVTDAAWMPGNWQHAGVSVTSPLPLCLKLSGFSARRIAAQ